MEDIDLNIYSTEELLKFYKVNKKKLDYAQDIDLILGKELLRRERG